MKVTLPLEPAQERMKLQLVLLRSKTILLTVLCEGGATQETYDLCSRPVSEQLSNDCANAQAWTVTSKGQVESCDCRKKECTVIDSYTYIVPATHLHKKKNMKELLIKYSTMY